MSSEVKAKIVTLPEFSVAGYFAFFLSKKRQVSFIIIGVTLIGLLIALTSPEEYRTNTVIMPENASSSSLSSLKGLAGLAGMAGLSLPSDEGSGINPDIYPQILVSTPFLTTLLEKKFYFKELGDSVSLYNFITEHQKESMVSKIVTFPFYVLKQIRGEREPASYSDNHSFIYLDKTQLEAIEDLKSRIMISVDMNTGLITISGKMQDPVVVAEMTKFTLEYVSNYVKDYYVQKEQKNLDFIIERYEEAKIEFQKAQLALASFRDNNRSIGSESARIQEQRLQSEYDTRYNVYNSLTQQLEESKIAVQKKVPVYTVLEPVKIPFEESEPQRLIILIFSFVFGSFLAFSIYLIFFLYAQNKERA